MMGAMIRGHGQVGVVSALASGGGSATRIARLAGVEPSDAALVGIRPATVVWLPRVIGRYFRYTSTP